MRDRFLLRLRRANWKLDTTSPALMANGVTANATKKDGILEACKHRTNPFQTLKATSNLAKMAAHMRAKVGNDIALVRSVLPCPHDINTK